MAVRHSYQRGDVILVQFPFSGLGGAKDRPAVVLSTHIYHDEWDELLVVAITSRILKKMRSSDCPLQDWKQAGLQHASWVRSHLATVHRMLVHRKLGALTPRDLSAVENCLHIATGL